jgi:glucose/arabinose dehydrogenase
MFQLFKAASVIALFLSASALSGLGAEPTQCPGDNAGLTLPEGFCAEVFADSVGRPRHLAVDLHGNVFVALARSRSDSSSFGVLGLRDRSGAGVADFQHRFGDLGGNGIVLHEGYLYFAPDDRVLRYPLHWGTLETSGPAETLVSGLPSEGSHRTKSIVVTDDGDLYVNIGSVSNVCQEEDSPGQDPCPQLETRAGIWKFDANRTDQTQADGERFATGLRNVVALALNPHDGGLYGVQHGRDRLAQNWPDMFTTQQSAEKPSEEMVRIESGDDFGWPYCYHDPELNRLVLAPEYGGDGSRAGRCAEKKEPIAAFPAHWAPNALLFYEGDNFPERYRGGAFIAFHGSWNRAPEPQAGYNVVFVPFENGQPSGDYEVFADGFAGAEVSPRGAAHRPTGLAVGPDGTMYIADDRGGRIYRVFYVGG